MNMPLAIALIVAGLGLLLIGLGSLDAIQNAFSRLFSGHATGRTAWLIVVGCVSTVVWVGVCIRSARS